MKLSDAETRALEVLDGGEADAGQLTIVHGGWRRVHSATGRRLRDRKLATDHVREVTGCDRWVTVFRITKKGRAHLAAMRAVSQATT